ncbi:unnamed protein product [Parnassius apollo]|uniref:(apollo) hypothetical protein n=1 Tax=Parnassius apollo TaxID=110799 RepID=A0A8S3XRT9_PARAO|nr:unnamed protein product [Parnassius apollo]
MLCSSPPPSRAPCVTLATVRTHRVHVPPVRVEVRAHGVGQHARYVVQQPTAVTCAMCHARYSTYAPGARATSAR